MLELDAVSKEYVGQGEHNRVLTDVSLTMAAGETLAIVGPSGCGKSTLLNIIGTLDTPTSGTVRFEGKELSGFTEADRAQFRNTSVGFVFQRHHLLPQCTSLENVLVPTLVHRTEDNPKKRANALLERMGLGAHFNRLPSEMSGGERQRVAVARALINCPKMLLADEPTGSLSESGAEDLTALLLELNREEKIALIVVTHDMKVASKMARALLLRAGALVASNGGDTP